MCGCETASERMTKSALWAPAPKQKVTFVEREGPGWTVSLDSEGDADCPICGTRSSSRHGAYIRSLQDLPAQGAPVVVQARVTRWRCLNDQCERGTFAERRLDLTARFARRTTRIAGIVRLFGHAAGGRPSERLLGRLGMPVGHTTILRHVKRGARGGTASSALPGLTSQCCINRKVGRDTDAYNERTARAHPHNLPVSFGFAGCHRATCESTAQARVI